MHSCQSNSKKSDAEKNKHITSVSIKEELDNSKTLHTKQIKLY